MDGATVGLYRVDHLAPQRLQVGDSAAIAASLSDQGFAAIAGD